MEKPSGENAEHPTVIANDAAEHPTVISNDAAEHPTVISNDDGENPTVIPDDVSEQPAVVSDEAPEQPTAVSDDAPEQPSVVSNDVTEQPTVVSDDAAQQPLPIPGDADYYHEDMAADVSNHGSIEIKHEVDEEEVKQTLEAIASTGKFRTDWEKLRSMLSFQLKQVLLEYPEAKSETEQQSSSLGETFEELGKRLDEALYSFVEGPPFTLQRLCEILLAARSIYPKLSKLALALEKNLLVTSTLVISTDPDPQTSVQNPDEANKSSEVQNGEPVVGDRDEIMADVEEVADVDEEMLVEMASKA